MFSLIISIIAIALVAALALASIYYGGSAFQEGSADAEASTIVNQGQQIQGAFTLADVDEFDYDNATATKLLERLVEGDYMKEVPSVRAADWVTGDNEDGDATFVQVNVVNDEVCKKVNEQFDGTSDLPGAKEDHAFGCFKAASQAVAYYKL